MIELNNEIPFLWRLSAESSEGYCSVAMVVPCPADTEIQDLTIETSVMSLSSDRTRSEKEETLEWNQEDIRLFLKLVNQKQLSKRQSMPDTVRIDLADPEIIDIIHIVAAAGFGVAFTSYGLLKQPDSLFPVHTCNIGAFASLNTVSGFKSCVIVDVEDDDPGPGLALRLGSVRSGAVEVAADLGGGGGNEAQGQAESEDAFHK